MFKLVQCRQAHCGPRTHSAQCHVWVSAEACRMEFSNKGVSLRIMLSWLCLGQHSRTQVDAGNKATPRANPCPLELRNDGHPGSSAAHCSAILPPILWPSSTRLSILHSTRVCIPLKPEEEVANSPIMFARSLVPLVNHALQSQVSIELRAWDLTASQLHVPSKKGVVSTAFRTSIASCLPVQSTCIPPMMWKTEHMPLQCKTQAADTSVI
eukprot:2217446-Amphidinium_carterae.1